MKLVAFSYDIGSFGKLVAMELAQNIGLAVIPFNDIYTQGLERSASFRRRLEDTAEGRGDVDIWEGHFFSHPESTSLFEAIVYDLASRGDAILMGHGVQALLAPIEGVLHVHVTAPLETRINRFMELNQITVHEANQTVKWWDQRQKSLFEFSSSLTGERNAYDLVINTDHLDIPVAARLLADALTGLPGPPDEAAWRERLAALARAKQVECAVREGGSAVGLAPLEVHPIPNEAKMLMLSGFVHSEDGLNKAALLATTAAADWHVKNFIKVLRLHNDLSPPQQR